MTRKLHHVNKEATSNFIRKAANFHKHLEKIQRQHESTVICKGLHDSNNILRSPTNISEVLLHIPPIPVVLVNKTNLWSILTIKSSTQFTQADVSGYMCRASNAQH
jgi:hypothetical protein